MGTSMASVSFRRTDSMNRPDMRLRVEAMYQDVKGLVSNLDQGNNGCAIVSPHGDQETLLQNMAEKISALLGDYAVFCICADSDFALLELYHKGMLLEKSVIGALELVDEIDELSQVELPDPALWKPLLLDAGNLDALQQAFTEDEGFAEDQLLTISELTGIPIFDETLVYGDDF